MVFDRSKYKKSTSLIIPCYSKDIFKVKNLIENLGNNKYFLNKTIIIYNNVKNSNNEKLIKKTQKFDPDHSLIISKKRLNPGEARNIGIENSDDNYIAFLDVSTIPEDKWLEKSFQLIEKEDTNGLLGNTKYIYKNSFEKVLLPQHTENKTLEQFQVVYLRENSYKKLAIFFLTLDPAKIKNGLIDVNNLIKKYIVRILAKFIIWDL